MFPNWEICKHQHWKTFLCFVFYIDQYIVIKNLLFSLMSSSMDLTEVWVPANDNESNELFQKAVIVASGDKIKVRLLSNNTELELNQNDILKCNPQQFDQCDDMASLTYLNEPSVLNNLKLRYQNDKIYTHSGLFLVAINPYKSINIYNNDFIKVYKNNCDEVTLKPHIFGTAQLAFENLINEKRDQSILVTGESGAGKTENTKKVIQYILSVATSDSNKERALTLESQIMQANPILESFGNATTVRNLNSSRFGKFIKINIEPSKSEISGAYINWYLLEKSRVITQNSQERNYHVFYQLLKGSPDAMLKQLNLESNVSKYDYLNRGLTSSVNSINDKQEFQNLLNAFKVMNFSDDDILNVFKVLSIILHLGNINFKNMNNDKQAVLDDSSAAIIDTISQFLGVPNSNFKKAILNSNFKIGREVVSQQRTSTQAKFAIDALSKMLYEKLFQFLMDRINSNFDDNSFDVGPTNYIGILDIAGFEIFEKNSFEQLCINYTNEKLQQFFNHHMFVLEQSEYLKEGISWQYIDFGNELKPTIELIEGVKGRNSTSIFSILDEECVVPKGSDSSFIEKLFKELESKDKSKTDKSFKPNKIRNGFIVKHYAGEVDYSVDQWIDKNKDPLSANMVDLLSNSNNFMIMDFFDSPSDIPNVTDSPTKSPRKRRSGIFRTVAQRHKEQLDSLMSQLSDTHPHFVRCILPNTDKKPELFKDKIVLDQLRCNGVLEGIRIARSGYPNRIDFKQFATHYSILASKFYSMKRLNKSTTDSEFKQLSEVILCELELEEDQYKVGVSKLFFRNGVLANLEKKRDVKLNEIFTSFHAICKSKLVKSNIQTKLMKMRATKIIVRNLEAMAKLTDDPWFKLISKIKPKLDDSSTKEVQYNSKIKKLEEEVNKLTVSLSDKDKLNDKADELQKVIDNDQIIIKNNEGIVNESKKRIVSLEKDLSEVTESFKELESYLTSKDTDLSELKKNKKELEQKVQELTIELTRETKSKNSLEGEIKLLKSSIDEKEKDLTTLNIERKSLNSNLESKIKSVESKLTDALAFSSKISIELEEKKKSLDQSNNLLNQKKYELEETKKSFDLISDTNTKTVAKLDSLNNQNKELESMRLAYEQADRIKIKYKQLKHDFIETKALLDKKINEEIEFDNGRQFFLKELESTKKIVADLREQLAVEKKSILDLENKLKVVSLEKDRAINEKKQSEMDVSQMKMRLSSNPDALRSITSSTVQNIESNQLSEEIRILRTRLASESYENRQMKHIIKRNGISWSPTSLSTVNAFDDVLDDSSELKTQLKSERDANERLQKRCVELQKDLLQYKSTFRDSMSSYATTTAAAAAAAGGAQPNIDYQYKYETLIVESEHKEEVINALKSQLKRMEMAKKRITSIHKQSRDVLGDISNNTNNKMNTIEYKENQFSSNDKDSIIIKQENLRLNSQLNELRTKVRRFEMSNGHKFEQEEQIVQLRSGIQALEVKNSAINASLELYKARSDDYFEKLSKTEVEVASAIRDKKVLEIELTELKSKLKRVSNQREESESKVDGLNEKIRQYEREISDKVFELNQLREDYLNVKDQLGNSEELRKSTSEMIKEHRDSEVDRIQGELIQSMNRESELTKQLRNISLQMDSTRKENQSVKMSNGEIMKEINILKRALNECMEKNDGLLSKIKEHVMKSGNLVKQVNTMKTVNEDLIRERDELLISKRGLEDKLYDISKQLEEHMKQVKNDAENSVLVDQLRQQVNDLETEKYKVVTSLSEYEDKVKEYSTIVETMNGKYVDVVEDNKRLTRFNQSIQDSMSDMRQKMSEELENKERHWKGRIGELDDKLFMSVSSQRTESHKIESLERVIKELERKIEEINLSRKRYREEGKSLEEMVEKLRGSLHSANEREAQSELKCKQLQRRLEGF